MNVTPQERENYRQALEAWKQAYKDAQKVKDRVGNNPTTTENMYLMTAQDMQYLNKEYEMYQRLASIAQNM